MKVKELPVCDVCRRTPVGDEPEKADKAVWDGPTKYGAWAYMCERHMQSVGYPGSKMNTKLEVKGG